MYLPLGHHTIYIGVHVPKSYRRRRRHKRKTGHKEKKEKGRYQEVIVPLSISLRLQNDLFAYREGEPPIHSTYTLERFLSNHLWAQTTGWSQAEGPLTEPSKGLNPEQTRECRTDWIIQTTLLLIPSTPRPPDFSFL